MDRSLITAQNLEPAITISAILLHLTGAVCLLLWGTRMVRTGFSRAYGARLQKTIAAGTSNRFTALLAGAGVTAILQSSTATALILNSFVSKQMIGTAAALAVIIGADISTTLIAQVLSHDLSLLSPALLSVGIILHMSNEHGGRKRHLARVLIGLGLMLLALGLIRATATPLQNSEVLPLILAPLNNEPILAILVATIMSWLLHSSLASVLLFASFAAAGLIPVQLGLYLILGANIGSIFVPYMASYKSAPAVRRIPTGNLLMRFVTIIIVFPFMGLIASQLQQISADPARMLVNFHTVFNITLALIFIPLLNPFAALCEKLVPDADKKDDPKEPQYLDENALSTPVIALAGAARETLRMAEIVEKMLAKTIKVFETNDEKLAKAIRKQEEIVDHLYTRIKLYMTRLTQEALDPKEADRYVQILTFSTNLEHVGDIIDKNLMDSALKKATKQEKFSKKGFEEIKAVHAQVLKNIRTAQTIFLSEDPKLARELIKEKKSLREAEIESSVLHFERLRSGTPETLATSSLHLDVIRDYRRINSYITSVAYAIIENARQHSHERGE